MGDLTQVDRVVALLEWGDIAEADAEIEAAERQGLGWQASLWRAMRALMDGRFRTCERLANEAAARGAEADEPQATLLATVLVVALRRDQERVAEAEILLRALVERHPSAPAGAHALLALLTGEMGRDSQARQHLARQLPQEPAPAIGRLAPLCLLAVLAADIEAEDEADLLYRRILPHTRDFAVEDGGAVFYGSASFALGRLAHTRGRWDEAVLHYQDAVDAHARVGAPVLLAHSSRHLAALLRIRGDDGDWERGFELLTTAAAIYRQLGIDGLAASTQAVLARSVGGLGPSDATETGDAEAAAAVFRRQGDGWVVGTADDTVRLRDAKGLRDIARLLRAPRSSIHVADLLAGVAADRGLPTDPVFPAGTRRPWDITEPVLDEDTRQEYEGRLADLASELVEAERAGDAVRAALARAERDALASALAEGEVGDLLDRARQAVGTRIRISLDRIERAHPDVGRHLRASLRTGTFCSYEPDHRVRWQL